MNGNEMSALFDVLYNNITSNQAPGLNEYEKSVFLTKAQSQLITEYFNYKTDAVGGGFDGSLKRQYDFSSLIRTKTLYQYPSKYLQKIDQRSKVFMFPNDYFLSVNETIYDDNYLYIVIPISYSEYNNLMLKPYSMPVKRAAWRLITNNKSTNEYLLYSSITLTLYSTYPSEGIAPNNTPASFFISTDGKSLIAKVNNYTVYIKTNVDPNGLELEVGVQNHPNIDDSVLYNIILECFLLIEKDPLSTKLIEQVSYYLYNNAPSAIEEGTASLTTTGKIIPLNINTNLPIAEIIGKFKGSISYQLRYIKKPNPIVLEDLDDYGDDITIEGIYTKTDCQLPIETHEEILERAVYLALLAWTGSTKTQVQRLAALLQLR